MRPLTSILFLIVCLAIIPSQAQTPYDAFAPETSRPMLYMANFNNPIICTCYETYYIMSCYVASYCFV